MSTFGGKIEEIENISVDQFEKNNYNSSAYFLSHCHTDHMRGLHGNSTTATDFHKLLLNKENVYLYASPVSVEILKQLIPQIRTKLKVLPVQNATLVPVLDKLVSVTPIPAGHCPGSVMLLFEYNNKTILYTGDYRLNPSDLKKFNPFYNSSGQLKHIHKLYLDTTFFNTSYITFPKRSDSVEDLCDLMSKWMQQNEEHIIQIETPARYGQEYLFIEISRRLRMPIHVRDDAYSFYKCIPEMDLAVTTKDNSTRIHSGCSADYRYICKYFIPRHLIKVFRISAMIWDTKFQEGKSSVYEDNFKTRVCYSGHASFEEGRELIRFLKPDAIEPCVEPNDGTKKQELMDLLTSVMEEYRTSDEVPTKSDKLFSLKKVDNDTQKGAASGCDTEIIYSSLLDSPPRKVWKKPAL